MTHSFVGGLLQIISLITWMELKKDTGRMVLVIMLVASLVVLFASMLRGMSDDQGSIE